MWRHTALRARRGAASRGTLLRVLALATLLAGALLVGGFLVFAERVAQARPPQRPVADAIVALTGGAQRIEDAAALLARGLGDRLLISGVHARTSDGALAGRSVELARFIDCCIDLGREATDTHGNALEVRDWARRRGYRSLIVVTSAWHMPRSLAEIARVLPGVELVAYPVNPDGRDYAGWRRDAGLLRLLAVEYAKYLLARIG